MNIYRLKEDCINAAVSFGLAALTLGGFLSILWAVDYLIQAIQR